MLVAVPEVQAVMRSDPFSILIRIYEVARRGVGWVLWYGRRDEDRVLGRDPMADPAAAAAPFKSGRNRRIVVSGR